MKALNVRENISFFKLTSRIAHKEDFTSDVQKKIATEEEHVSNMQSHNGH